MSTIAECATAAYAITYLGAFGSKVRSSAAMAQFANGLHHFGVPTRGRRRALAYLVVLAEAIVLAALIVPFTDNPLLRIGPGLGLLAVFTVGVAIAGAGSATFSCHCFGSAAPAPATHHLAVNAVLLALGVAAIVDWHGASSSGASMFAIGLGAVLGVVAMTSPTIYQALAVPPAARQRRLEGL